MESLPISSPKFPQRIACLWFPNWPIQRLVVSRPELRRRYLILFQQDPRRGRLVTAASPLANQAGVRVGMPLSEAQSLLQRAVRPTDLSALSNQRSSVHLRSPLAEAQTGRHATNAVQVGKTSTHSVAEYSARKATEHFVTETNHSDLFFSFEHDPAADRLALTELADGLSQFSPIVGLEQLASPADQTCPSSIFLEITGLQRLFGSEEQLAAKLLEFVQGLEYVPRLAIANTIGIAWGASRFGTSGGINRKTGPASQQNGSRTAFDPGPGQSQPLRPVTLADSTDSEMKATTPEAKFFQQMDPEQCRIIPAEDREIFLSLPIESLRLESHTLDLLHQLGIKTNQQLWRLPRAELAMRFGESIHRRMDQATGRLAEPVVARQTPTEFAATQLLEYPTHHRETIEVIIGRLLEQIGQQLHARQQGGLQWLITLRLVDQPAIHLNLNLFQASATASEIMPLVEMQLEQHLHPKPPRNPSAPAAAEKAGVPKGVLKGVPIQPRPQQPDKPSSRCRIQVQEIRVAVTLAVLLVPQQRLLFDEEPQLNRQALTQLINRLTSRLGQPQVVYPQLLSGAQPEYSYCFRPLVDIHRRRRASSRFAAPSHVVGRPLRIFNPAIEIGFIHKLAERCESSTPCVGSELKAPTNPNQPSPLREKVAGAERPLLLNSQWQSKDGATFTITQAVGPERIETGWWRGPTVCRDYWRVATDTGQSLWIYRDLRQKSWHLQGEF